MIFGSETSSAVRTRGVYHLPTWKNILEHPDKQCSSYDNSVVPWGKSAEQSWIDDRDRPYVAGQFIWTGFDYIGEPTPYGDDAKSSYFGIVDTCGFPKDIYYFYKSQWKKQTFPLTFQHKDNSFSLYDTNDSKSQCRDKKLQLVGCEKSPI